MDFTVAFQIAWLCFLFCASGFLFEAIRVYFKEKPTLQQSLVDLVVLEITNSIQMINTVFSVAVIGTITIPVNPNGDTGLPPFAAAMGSWLGK